MEPGQRLGRYQLIRRLGSGAFGDTFVAGDTTLSRQVVLKIAPAGDEDASANPHLRAEARAGLAIHSPYIASVFESGRIEGTLFLAREFVEGPALSEVLDRTGTVPADRALSVIRCLAEALSAAHRQGVIHRDLKPSNVAFRNGDLTRPVLLDFGVSGVLNPRTHMTVSGQIFGTVHYMSPEQVLAKPQSPATDIYGLGVLLYEMLYGTTPFRSENQVGLIQNILTAPVEFPASPGVPLPVEGLIARCLHKNPADRPQTAEQLIGEIDSVMSGPAPSRAVSPPLTARGPAATAPSAAPRRRSGLVIGAVIFCLLLVAATYAALSLRRNAPAPPAPGIPLPALLWSCLGALAAAAAFPLGFAIRALLRKRKGHIEQQATDLLFGAKTRKDLTETLAIEVDKLVRQLDRIDERIIGVSIAIMVDEFRRAHKADERQKALMQVMELMEKIRYRLTPWYVRHDKLIAVVVSVLTCLSGLTTALANIYKSSSHP